nr:MAG TPA: hypothetical protein [Caudoviricetes sp.]
MRGLSVETAKSVIALMILSHLMLKYVNIWLLPRDP